MNISRPIRRFALSCFAGASLFSCAPLVTRQAVVPVPAGKLDAALTGVARNLDLEANKGPLNARVCASRGFVNDCREVAGASMFFQRPNASALNPTGILGTVKVQEAWKDSSRVEILVGGNAGADVEANAEFFRHALQQQIELDDGRRTATKNPEKTRGGYAIRNLVTPAWGTGYLASGNPYITRQNAGLMVGALGVVDAANLGLVAAGIASSDRADGRKMILNGLLWAVLWRGLMFLQISDIDQYNQAAASPYNLAIMRF